MRPRLRPAEPSDIPALAAFARETYAAAFGHTFEDPGDLTSLLDASVSEPAVALWLAEDIVTVAEQGGRIVAFAQYGPTPLGSYGGHPREGDAALHRIYVAEGLRNTGVGGELLRVALATMEGPGHDIYLDVWEGNLGAQRLYARHGFAPVGRVKVATASGASGGYDIVMVRQARP